MKMASEGKSEEVEKGRYCYRYRGSTGEQHPNRLLIGGQMLHVELQPSILEAIFITLRI